MTREMAAKGEYRSQDPRSNEPLLNLAIAAVCSFVCFGPMFGFNGDTEASLQNSYLATSIHSLDVFASLVGVILCTIPMFADLVLDFLSKEKTFAVAQDALARAFISVVVLGVASALLSVSWPSDYGSNNISVRKILVGFACSKVLISGGFLTRLCLFDRAAFPIGLTTAMTSLICLNVVLRIYTATVYFSAPMEISCMLSSALVLVGGAVLSVQCIVKFLKKLKTGDRNQRAPPNMISLMFILPFLAFMTGDIIVPYSYGLYSGLLTGASPVCLSTIIYILAGAMIAMNVIEGRHVRALIVASKVNQAMLLSV
jgi:hypothetical protein